MTPHPRMPARSRLSALAAVLILTTAGCADSRVDAAQPTETAPSTEQRTQPAEAAAAAAPVTIMGAGDIAGDAAEAGATARLILAANPDAVFTTGDNAYPDGSPSNYARKYEPTWGAFADRTHPVPGNHEYQTAGAQGYVDYFGAENVTNDVDGGLYYAWDIGDAWRAYALNSEISTAGAQLRWLRADVAAHPGRHYIFYAHRPRFTSSANHGPFPDICPLWDALAATGRLEIVLAGHNHHYERFSPMDCSGQATAEGARSFVVGSGGKSLYHFDAAQPGSEFRNDTDFGVLKLVLHEGFYEWEFIASGRGEVGGKKADTGNAGQILDKGSSGV